MVSPLRTDRLLLRSPLDKDAPDVVRLLGTWDVARMMSRVPYPFLPSHALNFFRNVRRSGGFARPADAVYMLVRLDDPDDRVMGCIGLHKAGHYSARTLGYWLGEPYWGQGFITEAARAAIDTLFRARTWSGRLQCTSLTADYFLDNPASGRVLTKLGFVAQGEIGLWSTNRAQTVLSRRTVLTREAWQRR